VESVSANSKKGQRRCARRPKNTRRLHISSRTSTVTSAGTSFETGTLEPRLVSPLVVTETKFWLLLELDDGSVGICAPFAVARSAEQHTPVVPCMKL